MEPGEMKYGVPYIVYHIVQTVGNLLQGVEKMMEYAGDAENAGDAEAATVFRTVADGNRVAAQALYGRGLNAHHLKLSPFRLSTRDAIGLVSRSAEIRLPS